MMFRIADALRQRWWRVAVPVWLRLQGVTLRGRITAQGYPIVSMAKGSIIDIAGGVTLCSLSRYTALGVARPVILRTLRANARIKIDENVGMSGAVVCAAESVEIGAECLLGADVMIFDTDFHALAPEGRRFCNDPLKIASAPVRIGRNVFVGARSIIMKGVTIGENAVVGAGSVVACDIPANCVVAGNPLRVVRQLTVGR